MNCLTMKESVAMEMNIKGKGDIYPPLSLSYSLALT